jgi:hypothetical protein
MSSKRQRFVGRVERSTRVRVRVPSVGRPWDADRIDREVAIGVEVQTKEVLVPAQVQRRVRLVGMSTEHLHREEVHAEHQASREPSDGEDRGGDAECERQAAAARAPALAVEQIGDAGMADAHDECECDDVCEPVRQPDQAPPPGRLCVREPHQAEVHEDRRDHEGRTRVGRQVERAQPSVRIHDAARYEQGQKEVQRAGERDEGGVRHDGGDDDRWPPRSRCAGAREDLPQTKDVGGRPILRSARPGHDLGRRVRRIEGRATATGRDPDSASISGRVPRVVMKVPAQHQTKAAVPAI